MGELSFSPISTNGKQYLDGAGRLEVSQSTSLGDYLLTKDNLPDMFDTETNGAATQSYNATLNCQDMAVTNNGDYAIFQTKQVHPYFTGRPQQPEFTYINFAPETDVIKRVGYYSSDITGDFDTNFNGTYLESSSGTVKLCVTKNGAVQSSIVTLAVDWTKFNITLLDFLYLGGSSVKQLQIFDGDRQMGQSHNHANHVADTIFNDPAQPIRAEIRSTGGAGTLQFVCANVGSAGGPSNSYGLPAPIDTGNTSISISSANVPYALLAVRKTNRFIDYQPSHVDVLSLAGPSEGFIWRLLINPTVSEAFTYVPYANRFIESWSRATSIVTHTVTPGTGVLIDSGAGEARSATLHDLTRALRIGTSIAGVHDVLVLEITLLTANQNLTVIMGGIVI